MPNKVGRPSAEYDLEKVEKLASRGLTMEQIADALGLGTSTVYDHKAKNPEFSEAIKRGKAKGIAKITNALFEQAIGGNTASAIFWLKNQAGWRDKVDMQVDANVKVGLREITDEEWKALSLLEHGDAGPGSSESGS